MFSKNRLFVLAAAASFVGVWVSPAQAVVSYQANVAPFDAVNTDFISGNGTPIDNFVVDSTGLGGVSVAIKPRNRDIAYGGEPSGFSSPDHYIVLPGQSANNPARPQLVFDYQFSPGADGVSNYQLQIDLDYDPAVGAATFYTLKMPIFGGWTATDGYFTNGGTGNSAAPTGHAWSDASPYVISNTTNLAFAPQVTSPAGLAFPYNSSAYGEYEVRLTAFDPTGTVVLAQATAFALVPEPGSLSVLGLAGTALLARRRNRVVA